MSARDLTRLLVFAACSGAGWLAGVAWRSNRAVHETPFPLLQTVSFEDAGVTEGKADTRPVLRIFGDYECLSCRQLEEGIGDTLRALARAARLRFVYHHAPLRAHPRGELAAAAAYCATDQGRSWPVHRALYSSVHEWSAPPGSGVASVEQLLLVVAARAGADPSRMRECLQMGRATGRIARDRNLADRLSVHAVPTVFLDNSRLEFRSLQALLRHVLRQSRPLT